MFYSLLIKNVLKALALAVVALGIPALAYTLHDSGDNGKGKGDEHGGQGGGGKHYSVPDSGPGMTLLVTTVGTILFFAGRARRERA
jgi:hypothetical protein